MIWGLTSAGWMSGPYAKAADPERTMEALPKALAFVRTL